MFLIITNRVEIEGKTGAPKTEGGSGEVYQKEVGEEGLGHHGWVVLCFEKRRRIGVRHAKTVQRHEACR